ncbi:MAG: hypothetical protein ACR2HH_06425 [Chthoniobacterales bacterium]
MHISIKKRAALGALCGLFLSACRTAFQNTAPEVASLTTPGSVGAPTAVLERGRKILTTRCTECHLQQPIQNYTVPQWHAIVRVMAPRAKLSEADRAALESYLVAARASP